MSPLDRALDALPPDALQSLQGMADAIATELGESPEAWRGAALMAHVIAIVGAECTNSDPPDPEKAVATLGLLVGLLRRHPAMVALKGPLP